MCFSVMFATTRWEDSYDIALLDETFALLPFSETRLDVAPVLLLRKYLVKRRKVWNIRFKIIVRKALRN